jgi:hypothetical protein
MSGGAIQISRGPKGGKKYIIGGKFYVYFIDDFGRRIWL